MIVEWVVLVLSCIVALVSIIIGATTPVGLSYADRVTLAAIAQSVMLMDTQSAANLATLRAINQTDIKFDRNLLIMLWYCEQNIPSVNATQLAQQLAVYNYNITYSLASVSALLAQAVNASEGTGLVVPLGPLENFTTLTNATWVYQNEALVLGGGAIRFTSIPLVTDLFNDTATVIPFEGAGCVGCTECINLMDQQHQKFFPFSFDRVCRTPNGDLVLSNGNLAAGQYFSILINVTMR